MDIIKVENVSKVYRLYKKPIDRLKETVSPFKKCLHRDFYALKAINFSIRRGESVGIIGTNGSGKSTILKLITGVLTPSEGNIKVDGKICALLELGAGFNMEYTGLQNIYMNGTMMGFTREEMDRKLPEILSFADIGDFIDQPVKSYSSGMFVRLAFSLYTAVDPEILIVDEALSVGDVFFQAKCYRRMDELKERGTTILMVTHDMGSVMKYCERVILLNKGEFISEGDPGEMIDLYKKILAGAYDSEISENLKSSVNESGKVTEEKFSSEKETEKSDSTKETEQVSSSKETTEQASSAKETIEQVSSAKETEKSDSAKEKSIQRNDQERMLDRMSLNPYVKKYGDGRAEIIDLGIIDHNGKISNVLVKGEIFSIREKIRMNAFLEEPIFTFTIKDKRGMDLSGTNTLIENKTVKNVKPGDEFLCSFTQKMTLQGGEYLLSMSCTGYEHGEHVVYDRKYDVCSLTVISDKNTVGIFDLDSKTEITHI